MNRKRRTSKELPPELQPDFDKAYRLEWLTIIYLVTVTIIMFLTMSSSQAMKVAWLEDIFSMVPAICFLVAKRYHDKVPCKRYPYGYHRAYSIAYQMGSFALLGIGLFVFYDSAKGLLSGDRPTIGGVDFFGVHIWMGWLMILALLWSAIPAMILGAKKLPLAKKLHNKILHTDALTQKADWETAVAAILGIIGIGFGLWWADGVAACFISITIIMDGAKRLKGAMADLLDEAPTPLDSEDLHPLVDKVNARVRQMGWIRDARVRMHEAGAVFFTEVLVIPHSETGLMDNINAAVAELQALDWKMIDVVIMPVAKFEKHQDI